VKLVEEGSFGLYFLGDLREIGGLEEEDWVGGGASTTVVVPSGSLGVSAAGSAISKVRSSHGGQNCSNIKSKQMGTHYLLKQQ
jgi:hypothetical protein